MQQPGKRWVQDLYVSHIVHRGSLVSNTTQRTSAWHTDRPNECQYISLYNGPTMNTTVLPVQITDNKSLI